MGNYLYQQGLSDRSYEKKQFEEVITDKGVTIFIDPTAVMFLMGCEMDWKEEKFSFLDSIFQKLKK